MCIWAVGITPVTGVMLTAAADKTIRLWQSGKCKTLVRDAHDAVIRALCIQSQDRFFTCDNGGVVKHWTMDVDTHQLNCLSSVATNNDFIYSMTLIKEEEEEESTAWAVGGEQSGIIVYRNNKA